MAAPTSPFAITTPDLRRRRAILFSARIQYSSETQPLREAALDNIVEQLLLIGDSPTGLTSTQLIEQSAALFPDANFALRPRELFAALDRLVGEGRILPCGVIRPISYKLAELRSEALWATQRNAERRLRTVAEKLFGSEILDSEKYELPFLNCISLIFLELSETYVQVLTGHVSRADMVKAPDLKKYVRKVKGSYPGISDSVLERAVLTFFQLEDPDYSALKWNIAQNLYISKALGLDAAGSLLSQELLSGAELILDTNVTIAALEPIARGHTSFVALNKACSDLNITVKVCQISVDELRKVTSIQEDLLRRFADQVPEELAPKISGVFYDVYRRRLECSSVEPFETFYNPLPYLRQNYGAELVDDTWFDDEKDSPETNELTRAVQAAKTIHAKRDGVARHDALLLRWVERNRLASRSKVFLLTLDRTLPAVHGTSAVPLAVTLDALLHWIAPVTRRGYDDAEFAAIFAQSIKLQLLPQESWFDIRDFAMLADVGIACKDLPAEDVENCLRDIKRAAPTLNVSDPRDREKLHRQISRFFADPGRVYKHKLSHAEAVQREQKTQLALSAEREHDLLADLSRRGEQITGLQRQIESQNAEKLLRDRRRAAFIRLGCCVVGWGLMEGLVIVLAVIHGTGINSFQRICSAWPFMTGALVIWVFLSRLIIGKERIEALGWPATKVFGT